MSHARSPAVAAVVGTSPAVAGDAEWLLTDGSGGYGCGSADDLARRRYHAFWVTRRPGTARRHLVVAGCDERIVHQGEVTFLMHAHWRDQELPSKPKVATTFRRRPLPTWTFRAGALGVERTVALRRQSATAEPALLVRWRNVSAVPIRLDVRPLLGCHDADHLPPADDRYDGQVQARGASWGVRPNATLPTVWMTASGVAAFRSEANWYRGMLFATDRDRGYDHVGDRWVPGVLELDLGPGQAATVAFTLATPCDDAAAAFDLDEQLAVAQHAAVLAAPAAMAARIAIGADDFLYAADGGRLGVLAGFPWFGEWGRDVFVSLPGLTIARGRLDLAAAGLRGALPFLRDGLLPNIYGRDPDDSHYDSCDAALWFSLAVARFGDAGGDAEFVRGALVPALVGIAEAYARGTRLGLAVDATGLLRAGRDDLNATWMDARVAGVPVTPRTGLPVEIQALWCALLAFLAEHHGKRWRSAAERAGKAFGQQFWLAEGGYMADRVVGTAPDRAVRPNMLVAAALSRVPLTAAQRAGVVRKARAELVTPVGLRTLSPLDPAYRGRFGGGIDARDSAYHQGTVWPWLAGFYVEAALAAVPKKERKAEAAALRTWLAGFAPELDGSGLDHISEVFDGDPPHRPGGTFAQAWNTGELLRALALCAEAGS